MQTISELKEQAVTDTPLMVFDCTLSNGETEHWSTHGITIGTTGYAARVLQHSAFDIQTASDQGVDGSPRISLVLANADSHFSEIGQQTGWKGAQLTVSFLFYDLVNGAPLTDTTVVFQGICNPPDQIKEATLRLSATNRMNLQRLLLPEVRIQRRCPWNFPATADQLAEAVSGGTDGKYSLFYRCGYSAGVTGGTGNLNGAAPFPSCGYTMPDCTARGMTLRFGGLEYVPPAIAVRGYGKDWTTSAVAVNQARYNDFVAMVYGTAWYEPLVTFARNDGNLTRMEVLLGIGQMQAVITVLVSGIEIPVGINGMNMTGTGWYNVETLGTRDGAFDPNFTDASGQPAGDPYGSMAYLSVVVPNQINDGNSLPAVQVLAQGLLIPVYDATGTYIADQFSNNPAWILLDVLRRSGWAEDEIDLVSFATAAAYCDQQIDSQDLNGNAITIPRFACNLVIQKRRSAGDVVRGVRNAARLYLTYGPGGVLQLQVENTLALQSPTQAAGSNSTGELNGGWPVYEFGDGSNGYSGILRLGTGEPSVTVSARSIADTPNYLSVEFQDSLNSYQQDSYAVVDADDIALAGQQVSMTLMAVGIDNYDQAGRILQFNLDKSISGNTYVEFETSVKAFGIRPGDIITVTYLKEGFTRQPFRVLKISPATNYRTTTITAQIHDDGWYADSNGQPDSASGVAQQGTAGIGVPRPLMGSLVDANGNMQFGIVPEDADGTGDTTVEVSFTAPAASASAQGAAPGIPLVNLMPAVGTGGTLASGQTLYYAVSALDAAGDEGGLSFTVRASITADGSSVTLTGLSFDANTSAFNVYRGVTPAQMYRIASAQAVASTFVDTGLPMQLVAPPDANFDHANFYWRMELQPEIAVTVFSATTLGNGTLEMPANAYRGMTARITRGTGAGQEQTIAANDATTATVSPPWVVEPDATSFFTIAEAGWHFGALTTSSPVEITVPSLTGETVQITGRSANVNDVECSPQLSVVTRWQITGSAGGDTDVPGTPSFGLNAGPAGGTVEVSGIAFTDLTNTQTISTATVTLYYWDELNGAPATVLSAAMGADDGTLALNVPGAAQAGSMVQIDGEVVQVTAVANNGAAYTITRAAQGSTAAAHAAGAPVYLLEAQTTILPFPEDFFGSPYSGDWSYPILLPDVRVACAQLYVTNALGNSQTASVCMTHSTESGLRTLMGGQYSIQVNGFLAVDQSAAPALVVETARSVGTVYAVLGTAADAEVQLQLNVNGTAYCQLTIAAGMIVSNSVDGFTLAPLNAGAQLTLAVLAVGQTYPGADLTVFLQL
jgi:hypothetical protein